MTNLNNKSVISTNDNSIIKNTEDCAKITLEVKRRIRQYIRDGRTQTNAITVAGVEPNSLYRHLKRRWDKGLDFIEANITPKQWEDIQHYWRIGMNDSAAVWRTRVTMSNFELFMDLDPRREIIRQNCMNDIEFRTSEILYKFLNPDEKYISKDVAKLALAVRNHLRGEGTSKKKGDGSHISNTQVNIYGSGSKENRFNADKVIDMANYIVENQEDL